MAHFHGTYKKVCDKHDPEYYAKFKKVSCVSCVRQSTGLRYHPIRGAGRGVIAPLVSLGTAACEGSCRSGSSSKNTYCREPWPVLPFVVLSVYWLPNKIVAGKASLLFLTESEAHTWVRGQY